MSSVGPERGARRLLHPLSGVLLALASGCAGPEPIRPAGTAVAARIEAGDRLRWREEFEPARSAYEQALAREPRARRAHTGRQDVLAQQGLDLELRRLYREFGDPYLLGRIEGTADRQIDAFERAPEPDRSMGLAWRALREGRLDAAERGFERVTRMDPGRAEAWILRGRLAYARRELGVARMAYEHAAWIAPHRPGPWLALSALAAGEGRADAAREAARRAFERAPASAAAAERWRRAAEGGGDGAALREVATALVEAEGGPYAGSACLAARLWERLREPALAERARELATRAGAIPGEIEATRDESPGAALPPDLDRFVRRFAAGVEARYRHFRATGQAEDTADLLCWARALYVRETGEALGAAGAIERFFLVGELLDPGAGSPEPLVRRLAERGLVLVLGRRTGGPPEALLARVVRRSGVQAIRSRGYALAREHIEIGRRYLSGYVEWGGGGDLAGLALGRVVLVDRDAAAAWEGGLRRRQARLRAGMDRILAQEALADTPVGLVEDPAGVADRLLLAATPDLAREVLAHEDAHLADAERYLPGRGSLWAAAGLALRNGLAADAVLAELERNAQLAAIAEGPDARTALSVCCAALDTGGGGGPHARGYAEIVRGFVDAIEADPGRFPAIRRDRVIVQQLHRLTDPEIVALARELLDAWGLRADEHDA